jgi:arylsulfatase A-like enzyme
LPDSAVTLAKIFKENGYVTADVVGSFVLDQQFGLAQGFDYYNDRFKKRGPLSKDKWQGHKVGIFERTADEVTLEALNWLEGNSRGPFFLWVHYYDPHWSYIPPPEWHGQNLKDNYLGEIKFVDHCIGYLLDYLDNSDLSDKTMIVITSDHGEGLGEHDYSNHGEHLYDQELLVPLVVKDPSGNLSPGDSSFQINSIDIMPSILDLLSMPIPPDIQGKSFLPLLSGENKISDEFSYPETLMPYLRKGKAEMYSLLCLCHPLSELIQF